LVGVSRAFMPVEVVFGPSWWHKRFGICFDRGFFFDPNRRVADEQRMRSALADVLGDLGMGERNAEPRPVIGAVHLAAGYIIAEALGCEMIFHDDAPPDVIPKLISDDEFERWEPPALFHTQPMRDLRDMVDTLRSRFGYVEGDVNWSGMHNAAFDLRGSALFTDYYDRPEAVKRFMDAMADFLLEFVRYLDEVAGTSSITVNRSILHIDPRLHVISNCTVSMVSAEFYSEFLAASERRLAKCLQPYGVHHCGDNMDRLAPAYADVEGIEFFDVGYGSDVKRCRGLLPDAFFNIRLSPGKMAVCSPDDIISEVNRLAAASARPELTGFCCINLDHRVPDDNIRALYSAVAALREKGSV